MTRTLTQYVIAIYKIYFDSPEQPFLIENPRNGGTNILVAVSHVVVDYSFDEGTLDQDRGPNIDVYVRRVTKHHEWDKRSQTWRYFSDDKQGILARHGIKAAPAVIIIPDPDVADEGSPVVWFSNDGTNEGE